MKIVGIKINDKSKFLFYYDENLDLKKNLTVIVDTDKGLQFAKVCLLDVDVDESKVESYKIIRIANKRDYSQHTKNLKDAKDAVKKCREFVNKLGLDMYVIDAEYTFTRSQLLFRYLSDERIDFRELAKSLGSQFKTRIELRQIGVRDKAKEIGGVGPCGRRLCCNRFLNEFDSVSINMAKNQSLSLNPSKINGVCGRLLCCLKYENDNYNNAKKEMPSVGDEINNNKIKGKIISVDLLNKAYKVLTEKNLIVEVKLENGSKE